MNWRINQAESRARYLEKYDPHEVEQYDTWIRQLTVDDELACLRDIEASFSFRDNMSALDVGAGTGAMCKVLLHVPGISITALEPAPEMLAKMGTKPELKSVRLHEGFCDSESDRSHFTAGTFDCVVSRQLVNGLYDPLVAFKNWYYWLKPGGSVLVIDGLYDRTAWTGKWEEDIDTLPVSACRSTALVPYMLELAGFRVDSVSFMKETNSMPTIRTIRYLVVGSKPDLAS